MVMKLNNAEVIYKESFRAGLALDPDLTVNQWADEKRMLSSEGSAEPGPWRTDRVPFAKEIMECLSPSHPCQEVVYMKPTQLAGTEILVNFWGYTVDLAPGPFLLVEPTGDMARKLSKQRIATAIRDTPCLNEKITPAREKDSGNTVLVKEYPGGILMLTSPTSSGLQMVSIRYMALDEIDSYDIDIENEGDPIYMAKNRTSNYGVRRKIFMVSSPKIKGISIIEREYDKSDQRRYNVPCPECNEYFVLSWGSIKFVHDKYKLVSPVEYACKNCGTLIPEHCKTEMLENGIWIPENQENGQFPGFHINALYAPLGWTSWASIVTDFLEFKRLKSLPLQKAWTNTKMAETWEVPYKEVEYAPLFNRREKFEDQINGNIVVITAGIDTQDDRVEVTVIGWAPLEESYVLEHKVFFGDLSKPLIWNNLDQFLLKTYIHERGLMRISCAAIDTGGHYTSQVYEFVKPREGRKVYAIKGSSMAGMPISGKPSKQKNGVNLFMVGTDTVKDLLFNRLCINEHGAGYIHFPMDLTEEYFQQLTAEKVVTKYKKGFPKREYVKTRDRNEALDEFVYAIAALNIVAYMAYPNYTISQMLELLAVQMGSVANAAGARETAPSQGYAPVRKRGRMINEGVRIE